MGRCAVSLKCCCMRIRKVLSNRRWTMRVSFLCASISSSSAPLLPFTTSDPLRVPAPPAPSSAQCTSMADFERGICTRTSPLLPIEEELRLTQPPGRSPHFAGTNCNTHLPLSAPANPCPIFKPPSVRPKFMSGLGREDFSFFCFLSDASPPCSPASRSLLPPSAALPLPLRERVGRRLALTVRAPLKVGTPT